MKYLFAIFSIIITLQLFSQQVNPNPWIMAPDATAEITYRNPIIPGFYPDPSVCRVGDDYYLVNSTFEYFPGVPVFHSKDLINWEQIGHCIHCEGQIKGEISIFAPTIRYHEGTFYMITTNVTFGGNFFVTAENPAGPWSNAIWIDMPEIDPDLFFDNDGKAYVISSKFELAEIDISTGKLLTERRKVWNSAGGRYPEAPHIYKKDGFYYLMAAEGGTEEAHSVTIARSQNIWGPYIDNPANPIATHVNVAGMGNPIQGIGHADIIQAHDNSYWMVIHGYRSVTGYPPHHLLGRETCLTPVSWPKGGWPVVNGNGALSIEMTCPTLPQVKLEPKPTRTNFETPQLGLEWNYIQPPVANNYMLNPEKGTLTLQGSALKIGEKGNPTFVGRRLTDIKFLATTRMEFYPNNKNEEAGMILLNNGSHFDIMVYAKNGKRYLTVNLQFGRTIYKSKEIELAPGYVDLRIEGTGPEFIFSYAQKNNIFTTVEIADSRFLSTQTVGWFTGLYVGMYATGNGKTVKAPAIYNWFDYTRK
ncbi:MAG TPA: glycoside hydrolase family 43 protein [Prolixibacteraceae bacterium]|nr:glycoside hydrolase family 43 protein [Prolixibacteraceae bacterium]